MKMSQQERTKRRDSMSSPTARYRVNVHITSGEEYEDEEYDDYHDSCSYEASFVQQPVEMVGMWVIEAGPADGDWSSMDSVMILEASPNASLYMIGQDVDMTGFALHPNPADTFYAGSIHDWETRIEVPSAARESAAAAVGVRCRPFGGENDDGQLMWVAGMMVARTPESMCFVCVDLAAHGPIRPDTVQRLQSIGVLDRYANCGRGRSAEEAAAALHGGRKAKPSAEYCASKLDEFDEVRSLASENQSQWKSSPWHHLSRDEPCSMRSLRADAIATHVSKYCARPLGISSYEHEQKQCSARESDEDVGYDFYDSEEYSTMGDDRSSMDETSMDEVEELQHCVRRIDLNGEQVWATLVQGSRVL